MEGKQIDLGKRSRNANKLHREKNRSLGCRKICPDKLKAQLLSCRRVAKWWQNGDKIVTKWWLTFPTGERGTQFLRTVERNALILS